MSILSLDRAARQALAFFPRLAPHDIPQFLGNRGGFSGARLWRVATSAGPVCLRAWPERMDTAQLDFLHCLMTRAHAAGLLFVPRLFAGANQRTRVEHAGRWWEAVEWMPGRADFHARPSPARLEAACAALARLHETWRRYALSEKLIPCVQRRLGFLDEWHALRKTGWQLPGDADDNDPVWPVARRAWMLVPRWIERAPLLLRPWAEVSQPVHPCVCDPWHDHWLFEEDRLTGLIDYGAAHIDHPAVDLARALGSLVGDDAEGWRVGLAAYRSVRFFSTEDEDLTRALDVTGTILGAANWLKRLYHQRQVFEDRHAVAERLSWLVRRMEGWVSNMI